MCDSAKAFPSSTHEHVINSLSVYACARILLASECWPRLQSYSLVSSSSKFHTTCCQDVRPAGSRAQ